MTPDARTLTPESEALLADFEAGRVWAVPGSLPKRLAAIEAAARATAEARLREALARIERKALDWQARSVSEPGAAASGLSDIALTAHAALAATPPEDAARWEQEARDHGWHGPTECGVHMGSSLLAAHHREEEA